MALVGRALLGTTTQPPPPGSGGGAFSSWIAQNNSPGVTPAATGNDSSGAHPAVVAQAAEQAATQPAQTTGGAARPQAELGGTAQPTSPLGQKQTLGS